MKILCKPATRIAKIGQLLTLSSLLTLMLAGTFKNKGSKNYDPQVEEAFGFKGKITYPSSPDYDEDRAVYNKSIDARPHAIFFCEDPEAVKVAIAYAKNKALPVRVRSNGHSYEGFSVGDGAVVIDVSKITYFELSADKKLVKLGAGSDIYTVYKALWKDHLTIPLGSCPTVGVTGFTLGGGVGFSSRLMGLGADNLVALELITADGQHLSINDDNHADLMWACRGAGGGNFGVVVSLTFKTFPAPPVSIYKISWNWSKLYDITHAWFNLLKDIPKELMLFLRFTKNGSGQTVSSFGQYCGSITQLKDLLNPLLLIPTAEENIVLQEMDYMEAMNFWGGIPTRFRPDSYKKDYYEQSKPFKATSLYLKSPLPDEAIKVIDSYYSRADVTDNFTVIDSYGGQISLYPEHLSCFPHRQSISSVQTLAYWTNEVEKEKQLKWSKEYYASLAEFGYGAYRNYEDLWLPDWASRYYGGNFERLKEVKKKYDPDNLFRYEQAIPVE